MPACWALASAWGTTEEAAGASGKANGNSLSGHDSDLLCQYFFVGRRNIQLNPMIGSLYKRMFDSKIHTNLRVCVRVQKKKKKFK